MASFFSIKILDKVAIGATRSLGWEVLITIISFPTAILVNRTLGAEDRGLFSLVILVPYTVSRLGTCQWDRTVKGLITSKQISSKEAWRRTIFYTYKLSFLFIPIGIIASLAYGPIPLNARLISALYAFNFPFFLLSVSISSIYLASGAIDTQYLIRLAYQVSYLILVLGTILSGSLSVASLVLINIAIWFTSVVIGFFKKEQIFNGLTIAAKPPTSHLTKAFLPYAFESLSVNADIWAFSFFGSLATLGSYVAIASLMQPVGLVSNAFTSASTANLDWTKPSIVRHYLLKTVVIMSFLLLGLFIAGKFLAPFILGQILGKTFQNGEWMIPWMATIFVFKSLAMQFQFALQLSGKENAYWKIQTLEAPLLGIMLCIFGYFMSELGILIALVLNSIIKCVICLFSSSST
jgi:O-antigen/teichoic acid export membrane protein